MNTSVALLGSLFSGNIRLPRGHFNKMDGSEVLWKYSIIGMSDGSVPEVETIGSQPSKPKARIQLVENLIDDFMSKNQVRLKGDVQETGCGSIKALRLSKTFANYFIKFF